jgi:hypothetical protein
MRSLALFAATAASLTSAYAAFPVGDGEAFLTGTATYSQTDNLYLSKASTKSTGVATFTPGVSFEFGNAALAKNILSFSEQFVRYTSASSQNNELFNAKYDGTYSDSKSTIKLGASYVESAQNNRDARLNGVIVENTTESISTGFEWILSPKTGFDVSPAWENSDYSQKGFTDRESWSVPLNFTYEIAPKLKSSGGYRYRTDQQKAGADSTDHFFNLGAKGEFTPKLTGSLNVGYTTRDIKRYGTTAGSTKSTVGIISNFEYSYSDKTKLRASVGNDYRSGATGETQKVFSLSGGANTPLSNVLTADASLNYSKNDYVQTGRSDDLWALNAGLSYTYNKYLKINGSYAYQDNNSNLNASDFKTNTFSISASVRY